MRQISCLRHLCSPTQIALPAKATLESWASGLVEVFRMQEHEARVAHEEFWRKKDLARQECKRAAQVRRCSTIPAPGLLKHVVIIGWMVLRPNVTACCANGCGPTLQTQIVSPIIHLLLDALSKLFAGIQAADRFKKFEASPC